MSKTSTSSAAFAFFDSFGGICSGSTRALSGFDSFAAFLFFSVGGVLPFASASAASVLSDATLEFERPGAPSKPRALGFNCFASPSSAGGGCSGWCGPVLLEEELDDELEDELDDELDLFIKSPKEEGKGAGGPEEAPCVVGAAGGGGAFPWFCQKSVPCFRLGLPLYVPSGGP